MPIVSASRQSGSRILFSGCDKITPRNRVFGAGVLTRLAKIKTAGYTAADAAWWANECRTGTEATDAEVQDEHFALTLSHREYRELAAELDEHYATMISRQQRDADEDARYNAWIDEQAAASAEQDRIEAIPTRETHRVLRDDDGVALAVVLLDADPANLESVAVRARAVQDERGPLRSAAFIASHAGQFHMMDRDGAATVLTFTGSMAIRRETLESAFGVKV